MGDRTIGEIYRRAQTMGLVIQKKNIFPYLDWLHEQGLIVCIGGRPKKWVPSYTTDRSRVSPAVDFPVELALMMGYTRVEPAGGRVVSPLEAVADYGPVPINKAKVRFGIQSGLGNLNPLY